MYMLLRCVHIALQLNYTHDPIADFINAVSSDMVAFASKLTWVLLPMAVEGVC